MIKGIDRSENFAGLFTNSGTSETDLGSKGIRHKKTARWRRFGLLFGEEQVISLWKINIQICIRRAFFGGKSPVKLTIRNFFKINCTSSDPTISAIETKI